MSQQKQIENNTIPPGLDLFQTDPDATFQDFAKSPIPGLFFGLFYFPFRGKVHFKGKPIARPVLGTTDTVVLRKAEVSPAENSTTPIEIVELSMVSTEAIKVRRLWWKEEWEIFVGLSPAKPSTGEMTISEAGERGGVFDSRFEIYPCFTFRRKRDGKVKKIDLSEPIELETKQAPWLKILPPGLNVPKAVIDLSAFFFVGYQPNGERETIEHKPPPSSPFTLETKKHAVSGVFQ